MHPDFFVNKELILYGIKRLKSHTNRNKREVKSLQGVSLTSML